MDRVQYEIVVLLACSVAAVLTSPAPLAAIHVKYTAPAHVYSGAFYPAGSAVINSNLVGSDPEAMWPMGVFLPPGDWLLPTLRRPHFPSAGTPFFAAAGEQDSDYDPLLVRGEAAAALVRAILAGGEMFYGRMPHARALLRAQEQRRLAGLPPLRMGSNRPDSPFYLWARKDGVFPSRGRRQPLRHAA